MMNIDRVGTVSQEGVMPKANSVGATVTDFRRPVGRLELHGLTAEPTVFQVQRSTVVIGSAEPADFLASGAVVSKRHVAFHIKPNGVAFVEDLGSRNGTFIYIDGVKTQADANTRFAVRTGDRVDIGNSGKIMFFVRDLKRPDSLSFSDDDDDDAPAPSARAAKLAQTMAELPEATPPQQAASASGAPPKALVIHSDDDDETPPPAVRPAASSLAGFVASPPQPSAMAAAAASAAGATPDVDATLDYRPNLSETPVLASPPAAAHHAAPPATFAPTLAIAADADDAVQSVPPVQSSPPVIARRATPGGAVSDVAAAAAPDDDGVASPPPATRRHRSESTPAAAAAPTAASPAGRTPAVAGTRGPAPQTPLANEDDGGAMLSAKTSAHLSSSSVKPVPPVAAETAFTPVEKPVTGKRGRPAASEAADAVPVPAAAVAAADGDGTPAAPVAASNPSQPSPRTAASASPEVAGRRASPPHKSLVAAPAVTPTSAPTVVTPVTPKVATVVWQFKKDLRKGDKNDAAFANYAAAESAQIEALYAKYKAAPGKKPPKAVSEPILNHEYRVDFVNMIQYRKDDPMKQRPIRRKEA